MNRDNNGDDAEMHPQAAGGYGGSGTGAPGRRNRILTLLWGSCIPIQERIEDSLEEEIEYYSLESLAAAGMTPSDFIGRMELADVTVINQRNNEGSEELEALLGPIKDRYRIISFGSDPSKWALTTVDHDVAVNTYRYLDSCGDENFRRMFDYIAKSLLGKPGDPLEPVEVPWQGIMGIESGRLYGSLDEYMEQEVEDRDLPYVGILASRTNLTMDGLRIERDVARDFVRCSVNPILVFGTWSSGSEGSRSIADNMKDFLCRDGRTMVDAVVKFSSGFLGRANGDVPQYEVAAGLLNSMNVSVCQPVIAARMSEREWRESAGLTTDIAWQIAYPEFEGVVDPVIIGSEMGRDPGEGKNRVSFDERRRRMVSRVANRIRLRRKPNSEKKVMIFLNNFPCHGVEGNVGNASGLDSLESIAALMNRMKEEGYKVDPPKDGRELIGRIMERKALSEFRWTTAQEMLRCGGVVHEMPLEEYMGFFSTLPEEVRDDVIATWGEPPGQGMVMDGKILITGVSFGNVMVAVQPKRGCFGSRCDGHVCKILHDPLCPPTHQFLATYHYYEHIWGADAVIHTGTHGSMEWTPGKGTGLSESCYPDICISDAPHLYIYNADNPAEGVVAKRRSLATLVDHMQDLMQGVELYGPYAELDALLGQYTTAKNDRIRSEDLRRSILDKAKEAHMDDTGIGEDTELEECVRLCHEALSLMRESQTSIGLHILGDVPEGDDRTDMVFSIMRYGEEHDSLRDCISDLMGYDLSDLYRNTGRTEEDGTSGGQLIHRIDGTSRRFSELILNGRTPEEALDDLALSHTDRDVRKITPFADMILDIGRRISGSDELGAMINGLNGGHIPSGPSGFITRGKYDVLPTGRNFYFTDPATLPTKTAWNVGSRMAEMTVERFVKDEGRMPESIGMFWNMSEVLTTGGEMMGEMMALIGVRPVWNINGNVKGFEVIPLEELGRPRIDITVNVSAIIRDNMISLVDYLDRAVSAVSVLREPPESNFVRKHMLESMKDGMSQEDATARLFGAPPGTYTSGISLAIFASAWKDEGDLANLYIQMKGHGYGGGRNGRKMYEQMAATLAKADAAIDGTRSDESDLLSCSCHFSNMGGMIAASRYLSGKNVRSYYSDTRDPRGISVRDLADEFRRVMRIRTLNPQWIEGLKKHGYKGAMDITKRITRLYGWQASTHEVDDWLFDETVNTFMKDEENRRFFTENNPYALEEMSRRLLEAHSRGLWNTDDETLSLLQDVYLEMESTLEGLAGEGEFQGGMVDDCALEDLPEMDMSVRSITEKRRKASGGARAQNRS